MKTIVKLTKIKDIRAEKFNLIKRLFIKFEPSKYKIGDTVEGILMRKPAVGDVVLVLHDDKFRRTSTVTEIINETTFKTLNSLYKLEVLRTEE
jgi:hypothetical protein